MHRIDGPLFPNQNESINQSSILYNTTVLHLSLALALALPLPIPAPAKGSSNESILLGHARPTFHMALLHRPQYGSSDDTLV